MGIFNGQFGGINMEYSNLTGRLGSKDFLKYALFSLMEEKSIYKITVKELCDKAMVSRSTFYDNYENLDDFYDQIMHDVASGLVKALESEGDPSEMIKDKTMATRRYTKWYQHVHDHSDEFRLLMGNNGTPKFRQLLLEQGWSWYTALLEPIMPRYEDFASLEILVNYIIGAHMGLLEYYLRSGMKYSVEYMAEKMINITMAGPYSILNLYAK